jgi:hypothetical protein
MERGFDTSQNCANGSEQFREVIGRGKEYLENAAARRSKREFTHRATRAEISWPRENAHPR